jgi:membrane protein required for colicin V production
LNILDFIILILLGIGAFGGYRKGLILEVIAILAFILAIVGGFKLLHIGMSLLSDIYGGFGSLLPFIAFLIIFIGIIILVNLTGKILKKTIDWTPLGTVDNLAGAIVGILKWALGISVLYWIFSSVGIMLPETMVQESLIFPYVSGFAPMLGHAIGTVFPSFESFIYTISELFQNIFS